MKKILTTMLAAAAVLSAVFACAVPGFAVTDENGISYDQVAGSGETITYDQVGVEGMEPIYGKDVKDGVYDVTVESSSSMFNVEKAQLTVKDGKMEAVMTMGGTGYLKIFLGTGKEAAESQLSDYIDFEENQNGKHTFTIPVEALDAPISCAAFSKNKEKWYDRSILFEAKSLPEGAVLVELPDYEALEKAARDKRIEALKEEKEAEKAQQAAAVDLADGEYTVEVELSGGTGRAEITSPAKLIVRDGWAYAQIQWSSSSYDYMKLGDQQYQPIQTEGNSTFEIPVTAFDEEIPVIADTTAMSMPHEIEYTLTFRSDSLPGKGPGAAVIGAGAVIIIAAAAIVLLRKRKAKS